MCQYLNVFNFVFYDSSTCLFDLIKNQIRKIQKGTFLTQNFTVNNTKKSASVLCCKNMQHNTSRNYEVCKEEKQEGEVREGEGGREGKKEKERERERTDDQKSNMH